MRTEQINIRLEADLVGALERVAQEEALDRATVIRRLLEASIKHWELDRALLHYRRGDVSLGRAAEEAGLTQWELLDAARAAGLAYPLSGETAQQRLDELSTRSGGAHEPTLPDIPPRPGGVLLVGINPAPVSVAAGHYYQGRLGRRLWRRLEGIGLLRAAVPGAEDEAFARAGHGLTDLVKRATRSAKELTPDEMRSGVEELRSKVRDWKPVLVLFAFKEPAAMLLGRGMSPGRGPSFEGVPTFLLSGPYASKLETERIDAELRSLLAPAIGTTQDAGERSQRLTATDLERGQIRLPRGAKRLFPGSDGGVDVVVRGVRLRGTYEPRSGPDRERSAVLRVGRDELRGLVREGETLGVWRGLGGVVTLD